MRHPASLYQRYTAFKLQLRSSIKCTNTCGSKTTFIIHLQRLPRMFSYSFNWNFGLCSKWNITFQMSVCLNAEFSSVWSWALQWRHNRHNDVSNTSSTTVYSTVYSGWDQRKHPSSASLAFVRGIHRGPVNSPHKWSVRRKMFPFDNVIMRGVIRYYKSLRSKRGMLPGGHCEVYYPGALSSWSDLTTHWKVGDQKISSRPIH